MCSIHFLDRWMGALARLSGNHRSKQRCNNLFVVNLMVVGGLEQGSKVDAGDLDD